MLAASTNDCITATFKNARTGETVVAYEGMTVFALWNFRLARKVPQSGKGDLASCQLEQIVLSTVGHHIGLRYRDGRESPPSNRTNDGFFLCLDDVAAHIREIVARRTATLQEELVVARLVEGRLKTQQFHPSTIFRSSQSPEQRIHLGVAK